MVNISKNRLYIIIFSTFFIVFDCHNISRKMGWILSLASAFALICCAAANGKIDYLFPNLNTAIECLVSLDIRRCFYFQVLFMYSKAIMMKVSSDEFYVQEPTFLKILRTNIFENFNNQQNTNLDSD